MIYVANFVRLLFSIYIILIFMRVLFAWLRPNMFNPIVRFVYTLTNPYLRLFAGMRSLRIGAIDLTPILALFLLWLLQEASYNVLLTGSLSRVYLVSLAIRLLFYTVYFVLFIFIATTGLRLIFEIIGWRMNNVVVSVVYSLSEPVVRPFRNLLRAQSRTGFDVSVLLSLAVLIVVRYLVLPRILALITMFIG